MNATILYYIPINTYIPISIWHSEKIHSHRTTNVNTEYTRSPETSGKSEKPVNLHHREPE